MDGLPSGSELLAASSETVSASGRSRERLIVRSLPTPRTPSPSGQTVKARNSDGHRTVTSGFKILQKFLRVRDSYGLSKMKTVWAKAFEQNRVY
jgi:hypothetical protein